MDTLDVIFRKDKQDGDATAVFPSLPGTSRRDFTVYAHVGQHSTGSVEWYWTTRPATPEEYAPLLAELRSIYERPDDPEHVTLRVVQRMTRRHYEQRKEACR